MTIHKQPYFMFDMCNCANNNQELLRKHKNISLFKCELWNYKNNERKQVKEHKNMYKQMPVYKCIKGNNPN